MNSLVSKYPNGVSSFGMTLAGDGIPATYGKIIFVDYNNGNDNNGGETMDEAVKTLSQAYSLVRTNKNDVIVLSAYSSHPVTEMLTVAKNRVHFVGLDGFGRRNCQGAKISMGITTTATDVAPVKVTGTRCTFTNIKFISSNTKAESLYGHVEKGEGSVYRNCSFHKNTDLDQVTAADILMAGDSSNFFNCEFGNDAVVVSVARPTMLIDAVDGQRMKHCYFHSCSFVCSSSSADKIFIKVNDTGAVAFRNEFVDCSFQASLVSSLSAAAITNAVASASGLVEGTLAFTRPAVHNCTNFCATTTDQVTVVAPASSSNAFEGQTAA